MRNLPVIEPELYTQASPTLRFLARDSKDHVIALVYWLGVTIPSREPSFYDAMQKFSPLMQLILPDECPGVFVNRGAVHRAHDMGVVKRLVFKDWSSLDVRYAGPCSDLYFK
jgi:hypothetical protein